MLIERCSYQQLNKRKEAPSPIHKMGRVSGIGLIRQADNQIDPYYTISTLRSFKYMYNFLLLVMFILKYTYFLI